MREFNMLEAGTGRHLGTVRCVDDVAPGDLVLQFRQDLIQIEEVRPRPSFSGEPGVHDARRKKKPA
jgi:hypothetical protein